MKGIFHYTHYGEMSFKMEIQVGYGNVYSLHCIYNCLPQLNSRQNCHESVVKINKSKTILPIFNVGCTMELPTFSF